MKKSNDRLGAKPNSLQAVAAEEGFSISFLYGQIAAGKLVARKCGRRTIIAPEDRAAWLGNLPKIAPRSPSLRPSASQCSTPTSVGVRKVSA
jgi:hypothetical protein